MRVLKCVEERKYDALEFKCKTQETVIKRLSKNYYELKRKHDRAAMHYWMDWFKMDEESAEDLEDGGVYLIIIPDYDHPVMAIYDKPNNKFMAFLLQRTQYINSISRELVKYWAWLPEPEMFDAVENKEENNV